MSNIAGKLIWISDGASTATVSNNITHDATGSNANCIDLDGYANPTTGNVVYGNTAYNCGNYSAIALENASYSLVYNNLLHDSNSGVGVLNYAAHDTTADQRPVVNRSKIYNNVIYNTTYGFELWDASYVTWENNTVYNSSGTYGFANYSSTATYATHETFVNNIIAGTWTHSIYTLPNDATIWTQLDYNDVVSTGTEVLYQGGTSRTLTNLQSGGLMTHGITSDPLFVSTSTPDFHLQHTSPAINAGTNVGLTSDFAGTTVPQGPTPDIGAYEYVQTSTPSVVMTAPTNATVSGVVTVSASSTAVSPASIASVQFYLGSKSTLGPLITTTSSPNIYSYSWNTTSTTNGTYALSALATDNYNNTSTSPTLSVTIAHPSASSVTASPPTVTVATSTLTVATIFSKAMNTSITPTTTFNKDTSDFTLSSSSWSVGSTTFTATYAVLTGITDTGITASISGAQDPNGDIAAAMTSNSFAINTVSPTNTGISASPSLVTTVTGNALTVTATYSKALNPAYAPSVAFSDSTLLSAPHLTVSTSSFSNGNKTYSISYTVDDTVNETGLTASISGEQDTDGNPAGSGTSSVFAIDTVSPTGSPVATAIVNVASNTLTVVTTFSKGMNTGIVPTITFNPNILSDLTAGSASWTSSSTYSAAYTAVPGVDVSSIATVSDAQDPDGNSAASSSSATFVVDTITPTLSFSLPATSTSLTVPVTSLTAPGTVTAYFLSESSTTPSSTNPLWTATVPTGYTFLAAGSSRTLYMWVQDSVGNVSSPASVSVSFPYYALSATSSLQSFVSSGIVTSTAASITSSTNLTFAYPIVVPIGSSTISIPASTTFEAGSNVDFTQIVATTSVATSGLPQDVTPLTVLQYGLPSSSLSLSQPVTITVPVDFSYNSLILPVYRKDAGGTWTQVTSCVVSSGLCSFTTLNLSSFAVMAPELSGGGSLPADLGIQESADNPNPIPGSTVHITLTASNLGPSAAQNVLVEDNLPSLLAFVSAAPATGTFSSSTGVWTIGSMPQDTSTTLILTVTVNASAGQSIVNNAIISESGGTYDPNSSNNLATQTLQVGAAPTSSGGTGYGAPVVAPPSVSTTSGTISVPASSTASLAAALASLQAEFRSLLARANGIQSTSSVSFVFARDLELHDTGTDVQMLQEFLNNHGFLVSPTGPGSPGNETKTFGLKTYAALMAFQKSVGIVPAKGYFGAKTRNYVNIHD